MKATNVQFERKDENGVIFRVLNSEEGNEIRIKDFSDGVVTINDGYSGVSILTFIRTLAGILDSDSNFESQLQEAYGTDEEISNVNVSINGTELILTKVEATSPDGVYSQWKYQRNIWYKELTKKQ